MASRRCIDCSALIRTGTRCGPCTPTRPDRHRRPSSTQRGYTAEYRRNRLIVLAGDPPCVYCGRTANTADHLTPLAEGGTSDLSNLVPACKPCNSRRGGIMNRS